MFETCMHFEFEKSLWNFWNNFYTIVCTEFCKSSKNLKFLDKLIDVYNLEQIVHNLGIILQNVENLYAFWIYKKVSGFYKKKWRHGCTIGRTEELFCKG